MGQDSPTPEFVFARVRVICVVVLTFYAVPNVGVEPPKNPVAQNLCKPGGVGCNTPPVALVAAITKHKFTDYTEDEKYNAGQA